MKDWTDLLQPALKGRVGFVDAPRDFVGAVLKTLGLSFNASSRDVEKSGIPQSVIMERAAQLRRQARQLHQFRSFFRLIDSVLRATGVSRQDLH